MKTLKIILAAGMMAAVGCVVVSLWVVWRQAAQHAVWQRELAQRSANQAAPVELPAPQVADAVPVEPPSPTEEAAPIPVMPVEPAPVAVPARKALKTAAASNPAPRGAKPPRQDLLAREALLFVGVDSEAEQYWTLAINDASLSSHERQDLIEDLNEEGFPDPKNLTEEDLPLIMSRIALIEQHAADAMDDVNAAAFMEAYKDLWNMYARVTQW